MKKGSEELADLDATTGKEEPSTTANGEKAAKIEREMSELKSDVKKISDDIKRVVSELQKSIVEVRSAVSEIENPFNLLRAISSEKDLRKLNGERFSGSPPKIKSLFLEQPEKSEKVEEIQPKEGLEQGLSSKNSELVTPSSQEAKLTQTDIHSSHRIGLAYLNWVWSLMEDGLSPDDITALAKSCEFTGFLPHGSNDSFHVLAVTVEQVMSKGFTKNKLLVSMYGAAAISGVQVSSEDLLGLLSIAGSHTAGHQVKRKERVTNGRRNV